MGSAPSTAPRPAWRDRIFAPYLPTRRPPPGRSPLAAAAPRGGLGLIFILNEGKKKFLTPLDTASRWRRWRPYHVTGERGSGDRRGGGYRHCAAASLPLPWGRVLAAGSGHHSPGRMSAIGPIAVSRYLWHYGVADRHRSHYIKVHRFLGSKMINKCK